MHRDNVGLRRAMQQRTPLAFTVAVDDPLALVPSLDPEPVEDARRVYVTRMARQRLHQAAFRHRVLQAYRSHCAVCSLRHAELLDAAHILPDTHPLGEPVTSNGLALCKLHHTAFDVASSAFVPISSWRSGAMCSRRSTVRCCATVSRDSRVAACWCCRPDPPTVRTRPS